MKNKVAIFIIIISLLFMSSLVTAQSEQEDAVDTAVVSESFSRESDSESEEAEFVFDHGHSCVLTLEQVEIATQLFQIQRHADSVERVRPNYRSLTAGPKTAEIEVVFSGEWTPEAEEAFEYAVSIWERLISSPVTIIVEAQYTPLGTGILGLARPTAYVINEPNLPQANRYYPIALANYLANTDFQPGISDIQAAFNSQFDWYLGTDGNTPASQLDFVSVVLHELAHGLGFAGNMQVGTLGGVTVGSYTQFPGQPLVYDSFTEDVNGRPILAIPDFSRELASVLTSNNVYFDAPLANEGNQGARVELYAPFNWASGSSYSHLGESFRSTPHELMNFSLSRGNPLHFPGSVTVGLLGDLGWTIIRGPQPTFPSLMLELDESVEGAVFLPDFVFDALDPNTATYSLGGQIGSSASASIVNGNRLDVRTGSTTGTTEIIINITNTAGITTSGTVQLIVVREKQDIYTPFIVGS